jgi:hypothetical protein
MCKEILVILVSMVVDTEKNNQKKWRAEQEERHKGLPPSKKVPRLTEMGRLGRRQAGILHCM